MLKKVLFIVLASIFIMGCGNEAENNLNGSLDRYKSCMEDQDYITMASMALPGYIEGIGGADQFVRLMKAIPGILAQQGMKADMSKMEFGSPSKIVTYNDLCASVIPTTLPMEVRNIEGVITGSIVALSEDKGQTWFFLEGNNEGKTVLADTVPELLHRITLPNPSLTINGKTLVQRNGQWVQQ